MVIGMLGGSFCPPTITHIELSNMCVEKGYCDKVIWVPVNDAYRKKTNIDSEYRAEMVKLALADEENIDYSLHEQNHKEIIRTLPSIRELQEIYKNDKLLFIAGADKLKQKWMQKEEFLKDFGFIVLNRGDIDCQSIINSSENLTKWKDNIKILEYSSDVSSTMARKQIAKYGKTDLVKESVMEYIKTNKLFGIDE